MDLFPLYFLVLSLLYFNILFLIAQQLENFSIVDIGWGIGFLIITWTSFFGGQVSNYPQLLVAILVTIWSIRISTHIYLRNSGKPEDPRYRQWRKQWGKWASLRGYFQVFVLQAILLWIIALPVIHINYSIEVPNSLILALGVAVWIVGFVWESVADYHLSVHLNKPGKKSLLKTGLWKYSRHPNYFGEATLWLGIWIMVATVNANALYTIISPLLLVFLLRFVSGVPMVERPKAKDRLFQSYAQKTNAMFPWFPKD